MFPKTQYYLGALPLLSFINYPIGFDGTVVYYHVLSGKQLFLISPADKNVEIYLKWHNNSYKDLVFIYLISYQMLLQRNLLF